MSQASDRQRHAEELLEQLADAVADGANRIVLWGVSSDLLHLLIELGRGGLGDLVVGLIDHRSGQQGRRFGHHRVLSPAELGALRPDTVAITVDSEKDEALRALAEAGYDGLRRILLSGSSHYDFRDPVYEELTGQPLVRSHAGGYPHMQIHLYQALVYIARRGLRGHVAEFGVYKGGTLMFLARTLDRLGHPARVLALIHSQASLRPRASWTCTPIPRTNSPIPKRFGRGPRPTRVSSSLKAI